MKIKIGTREYAIIHKSEMVEVGGELYGKFDSKELAITLASKFPQVQQNETFLHELLHGICKMQDLEQGNYEITEHQVQLLAAGLYTVIKDNSHIFTMVDIKPD